MPIPPIKDSIKNHIYKLHVSNPQLYTVGKLSLDLKIPIHRVEGILKLKAIQAMDVQKVRVSVPLF